MRCWGGVQWVWWVCTVSTTSMCLLLKLLSAMIGKMSNKDGPLPQDEMEGVEEEEWVSSQRCAVCIHYISSSCREALPSVRHILVMAKVEVINLLHNLAPSGS